MMILSQDGTKLVNWNAIEGLDVRTCVIDYSEQKEIKYWGIYAIHEGYGLIGYFKEKDHAYEVLEEIMDCYQYKTSRIFKIPLDY